MSYEEPWGDEVGEGWKKHVLECHRQLKHLDSGYRIGQIKEKFGGLRYYYDSSYDFGNIIRDIMDSVVSAAEYKCSITCEVCGGGGEIRYNGGWWKTLCDEHTSQHRTNPVNPVGSPHCVHDSWQAGYDAGAKQ